MNSTVIRRLCSSIQKSLVLVNLGYSHKYDWDYIELRFHGDKISGLDMLRAQLDKILDGIFHIESMYFTVTFLNVILGKKSGFFLHVNLNEMQGYQNYLDDLPQELTLEIATHLEDPHDLTNYFSVLINPADDDKTYQFLLSRNNPNKLETIGKLKSVDPSIKNIKNLYKAVYFNNTDNFDLSIVLFKLKFYERYPQRYADLLKYTPDHILMEMKKHKGMLILGSPKGMTDNSQQIHSLENYLKNGTADGMLNLYKTTLLGYSDIIIWLYLNALGKPDILVSYHIINALDHIVKAHGINAAETYLNNIQQNYGESKEFLEILKRSN